MRTSTILIAVAAALGTAAAQAAVPPTLADVQAALTAGTAKQYFISGSSAAKAGIQTFVGASICGGAANMTTFTSAAPVSNPDFNAFACTATAGPTSGSMTIVYYRAESGSVAGVLPIFNNVAINQLDLTAANTTCPAGSGTVNCVIAGTALGNGPNDSWGPAGVVKVRSDLGISDEEPDAFVGNNSPYAHAPPAGYVLNTFGALPTQAQLKAMNHTTIFQQTFEIVVNTGLGTNVLSSQAVANILNGNYLDWSSVPAFNSAQPPNGTAVKAAATPIFVCNREVGSGTRTGASIFFLGDHCTPGAAAIAEHAGGAISDNFATSDELVCVNSNGTSNGAAAGAIAIGYVSVDNNSKIGAGTSAPNVQAVNLDGIVASNYHTAVGDYGWAFEATAQPNAASGNPNAAAMNAFVVPALQNINTAPQKNQINAIPGQPAANTASIPLQAVGVIFTTDFFRGGGTGNSCLGMAEAN